MMKFEKVLAHHSEINDKIEGNLAEWRSLRIAKEDRARCVADALQRRFQYGFTYLEFIPVYDGFTDYLASPLTSQQMLDEVCHLSADHNRTRQMLQELLEKLTTTINKIEGEEKMREFREQLNQEAIKTLLPNATDEEVKWFETGEPKENTERVLGRIALYYIMAADTPDGYNGANFIHDWSYDVYTGTPSERWAQATGKLQNPQPQPETATERL